MAGEVAGGHPNQLVGVDICQTRNETKKKKVVYFPEGVGLKTRRVPNLCDASELLYTAGAMLNKLHIESHLSLTPTTHAELVRAEIAWKGSFPMTLN